MQSVSRGRLNVALLAVVPVAAASTAFAQRICVGGPGRFGYGYPPKWAKLGDFDGSFLYCRGEREGESQDYFDLFSPRGYAIGVNVVLYAMTH
jgi:hypothetical protein